MTNAQLTAVRHLAHAQHDAQAENTVTVVRTDAGFEVRKGSKLQGVTATWDGADELARAVGARL